MQQDPKHIFFAILAISDCIYLQIGVIPPLKMYIREGITPHFHQLDLFLLMR